TRINLIQVWDYHEDDTMTFNLLYTFEKDNRIFQKEKFEEHYIPVKKQILLDKLTQMGYVDIEVMNFPVQQPYTDIDDVDWYCVIAKKI
ncbi:MAG: SAM-dependent methyltransferase, partial [Lachnospiraceae bacterium]|nr:SAM-dependent methyltransferase [Lachnospiraceae bacterium]